ncbi:MAG: hypothetical protein P8J50_17945 [Acidimicrobiales bacterium]|nr:hypothetical protein [Acidimicrobiales bacterium]
MSNGLHHPFTRALYQRDDDHDGMVRVTDGDRWGRFTSDGRWVEGDIREADPQLCGWVAGPKMVHHRISKDH